MCDGVWSAPWHHEKKKEKTESLLNYPDCRSIADIRLKADPKAEIQYSISLILSDMFFMSLTLCIMGIANSKDLEQKSWNKKDYICISLLCYKNFLMITFFLTTCERTNEHIVLFVHLLLLGITDIPLTFSFFFLHPGNNKVQQPHLPKKVTSDSSKEKKKI